MTDSLEPLTREQFERVANSCGTDKAGWHAYQRFYPLVLSQIDRSSAFTVIEMGYGNGASINLWKTFFPNSFLICIDRDVSEQGDGFVVVRADQGDPDAILAAIGEPLNPVRLIVDDGSHHPSHQLSCLSLLLGAVLDFGGFYIIEDIETSYWLAGDLYGYQLRYGMLCRWSAVEALKLAIDYMNRSFLDPQDKSMLEYSLMMAGLSPASVGLIGSITFGQNCALIGKACQGDDILMTREYPYSQFTRRGQG
ncbi:MAG: hypothetical protein ACKO5F_07015 [Synechococcus sp.]